MSLLRLPPETLSLIFDQIDSFFFREDLGRLTVSKQWLEFALPAFLKSISLSQESLRTLIASGAAEKPSLLNNVLEALQLELGGYQARVPTHHPEEHTQGTGTVNSAWPNESPGVDLVEAWVNSLSHDLSQLAVVAQRSHKLRTLRIQAWSSPPSDARDGLEGYLSLSTMQALLSLENLRVLVLDLFAGISSSSAQQGSSQHICPAISTLLPTLRTLHLRMRSICPDSLKPRESGDELRLSEVVINLSLNANIPGMTSAAHSRRCDSMGGGLLQLKADMQAQAETLVTRMASPKKIRILTHSLPQFETQSLDVLTGQVMLLDSDMAWDEDGKIVEEDSDPESELQDDDLAAFLDED